MLAEMSAAVRAERVAAARRVLAAGRLCQLRLEVVEDPERDIWCMDNWEAIAAEVGAELGISRGRASVQMSQGMALLDRMPRLAEVFAAGEVDLRVVAVVLFRTGLILDGEVLAGVDEVLAGQVGGWNACSVKKVAQWVDWEVRRRDPEAQRSARHSAGDRHVGVGPGRDGLAQLWGSVRSPDAALLDRRLEALAGTVCDGDPRTLRQRRADAVGALAGGRSGLVCECGSKDCPAAAKAGDRAGAQAGAVVIHVLATTATLAGSTDGAATTGGAAAATPDAAPAGVSVAGACVAPGLLPGYGAIPAEAVQALVRQGARVRPLPDPATLGAEPGYRPSTALADFIRARDLTCRFPGCEVPAQYCDLDHSVPWHRGGPTHPSNIHLKCRPHHLLKTFWTGPNGWSEQQFPDGTIEWTSPTGRRYTTHPAGALYFPQLGTPTGNITPADPGPDPPPARHLKMPTRARTRAQDRANRITWERALNVARGVHDPPPF